MSFNLLYALLLALHLVCGMLVALAVMLKRSMGRRSTAFLLLRAPEILISLTTVFFLFSYIYATNANMDYVQRFMASHNNLRLAPNSTQERLDACLRFLPLLAVDAAGYVLARVRRPYAVRQVLTAAGATGTWALPLAMASGILSALAFPSFLSTAGIPALGWICLVPLLLCLAQAPLGRPAWHGGRSCAPLWWGIFYGTFAGLLQTMISNYWLGTFNLLSLQFVSVVTALEYVPFMAISLVVLRRRGRLDFLVFPMAWTVFDWLRSMGFLGYPWGMLGTSQYAVIPLIQIASLTGVWGVTFLVTLSNSVIAWYVRRAVRHARLDPGPAIVLAGALAAALGWAGFRYAQDAVRERESASRSVRLALIQQNDDPRKADYRAVFDTLRDLTDRSLASDPDMVVWSETAFVPNIRRWSREDPKTQPLAALVRDFLEYQKRTGRWLITGNDDYSFETRDGVQERLDYNGSVLFSPEGQRVETYHKIHLVPFTEYFPYKRQLPWLYELLQSFDAYLWEPGDRRVVFRHPKVAFSTPICFEDVFPDDVRRFVVSGAEVILNLSNDFWSLTETEAMQHAANAIFRAVENDRPLVRASASGLTCYVDSGGRIKARSPFFEQSSLVIDVPLRPLHTTPYSRWGDWFPVALAVALLALLVGGLLRRRVR